MTTTKQALRQQVRQALRALTPAQRARQSAAALRQLEADPLFRQSSTVMLFHSLPDEIDTHGFLEAWGQAKRLLLPVVRGEDLELRRYRPQAPLRCGAYHIAEPIGEAFTDYAGIQLIVVPGVAFDAAGHRLGRGKGYYDRFLSHPRLRQVPTVGLCFPCQLLRQVPVEPHDVCVGKVITSSIYNL